MFDKLVHKYIKDYENTKDPVVQEKYGTLCSILSIICNAIMVVFKLGFGFLINSTAIIADGFNNFSDVGSNLATLFGFKLSNKHPDADHPYGHGRIEYIVGMIISFLIFFVGFSTLKESITKCIHPVHVEFNYAVVVVLIVAILLKLWMSHFNKKTSVLIDSISLNAAAQDSLNDVLVTLATLFSLLFTLVSDFSIDGIVGAFVSLLVIKSGYEIFKSTMDLLLGTAPDKELIAEITEFVNSYDIVLGIHDLMIHDYGPSRRYMTFHVEVDSQGDIMETHDQIDVIEKDILDKFNILTTIHMDPIDANDEKTMRLKEMVDKVVKQINDQYTIHDFRIVSGPTHTNLIFDVVLPCSDKVEHIAVRNQIIEKVKAIDPTLCCVIQVEHSYI